MVLNYHKELNQMKMMPTKQAKPKENVATFVPDKRTENPNKSVQGAKKQCVLSIPLLCIQLSAQIVPIKPELLSRTQLYYNVKN